MTEKERNHLQYLRKREKLLANPDAYREYIERRRREYWVRHHQDPEEMRKRRELREKGKLNEIEAQLHPHLPGESIEQTRAKYNHFTAVAIRRAEEYRRTKWRGMHRYEALRQFILEGMPDDEIIERIGIYKEANQNGDKPDRKLLEIFKRIVRGQISRGHYGMSLHELIKGEIDGSRR